MGSRICGVSVHGRIVRCGSVAGAAKGWGSSMVEIEEPQVPFEA